MMITSNEFKTAFESFPPRFPICRSRYFYRLNSRDTRNRVRASVNKLRSRLNQWGFHTNTRPFWVAFGSSLLRIMGSGNGRVFVIPCWNGGWKVKNQARLLCDVAPVFPFGETAFFRFERHNGDGNDNSISEIIVEARSKQDAFDRLPTLDTDNREGLDHDGLETRFGYTVDGDADSLLESWTEYPDKAETDAESEDDYIENYGRMFHQSWYLAGQCQTDRDAQADRAQCHADGGILYLD